MLAREMGGASDGVMTGATRLLLIRNAQIDTAGDEGFPSRLDLGLSVRGHRLARQIARTFERVRLAAIYTSPSTRARETSLPLASSQSLEPILDEKLLEVDFGEVEGKSYAEIAATRPELHMSLIERPTDVRFPGGEGYTDLYARALSAIEAIRNSRRGQVVAVVSHGGVLRAILANCLQMPEDAIFRIDQSYGGVSVVDWFDETPVVRVMNAQPTMIASRRRGFLPPFAAERGRDEP